MSDVPISDWIEELAEKEARQSSEDERRGLRTGNARQLILSGAPSFFREQVRELALDAVGLERLGLSASVSEWEHMGFEKCARVSVHCLLPTYRQTYTDLFYIEGADAIRCHTMEGEAFRLSFCVVGSELRLATKHPGMPMDSRTAARFVLERMVRLVRSKV